ncbi:MAG TPA: hypothetical protein VMK65_01235 [Longimicrobiales bacterium]|nr:hypothetical protein [Longimicrobiales bacterium]
MREMGVEEPGDSRAALDAFHRYHQWSEEDSVGLRFLLERVEEVDGEPERHRRRGELLDRAVGDGHVSREVAEEAYELSKEEGLEPAFALEIVRAGVAVSRPGEPEPDAPALQPTEPDWIEERPDPEDAHRERVMRETFRRLRRLFEEHKDPQEAFRALARADDLRPFEY